MAFQTLNLDDIIQNLPIGFYWFKNEVQLLPKHHNVQCFHGSSWQAPADVSDSSGHLAFSFSFGTSQSLPFNQMFPIIFKWKHLPVIQKQAFLKEAFSDHPVERHHPGTAYHTYFEFSVTLFKVWVHYFLEIYLLLCCLLHTNMNIMRGKILSALLLAIFLVPRTVFGT